MQENQPMIYIISEPQRIHKDLHVFKVVCGYIICPDLLPSSVYPNIKKVSSLKPRFTNEYLLILIRLVWITSGNLFDLM